MKIVHVIFTLLTGGVETMLLDIINEQSKTDEIHLLIINRENDLTLLKSLKRPIGIHFVNKKLGGKSPFRLVKLNYLIYKINPDVIHCHNESMAKYILLKRNAKIVLTVHDVFFPIENCYRFSLPIKEYKRYSFPVKNYKRYDKIFAISKAVSDDIIKSGNRCEIIINGVDFESIQIKENPFYSDGTLKIVVISRLLHSKKGQDTVLEAMRYLREEKGEFLKGMTENYSLTANVRFLGNKTRGYIYSHLKDYDLLIQPSRYEGFGLTVAEGMSACIPVLISDEKGPLEVIDGGKYGFVFEKEDYKGCAEKILYIKDNIDNFLPMLKEARERVKSHYSIKTTARSYIERYSE
ncbi:MAG: glycosyltransferase [Bacteroidales bacterium]